MPGAAPGSAQVGWTLTTWKAGTNIPQATYADASLTVQNPNPVKMDAMGTAKVWLGDLSYALSLTDTSGNNRGFEDYFTQKQIGVAQTEWQPIPFTIVYVSPTSFALSGSGAIAFIAANGITVGTRIKSYNSVGVIYSTITNVGATAFTVKNDSGALDAGMSLAFYGVIAGSNESTFRTSLYAGSVPAAPVTAAASSTASLLASSNSTYFDALQETPIIGGPFTPKSAHAIYPYRVCGELVLQAFAGTTTIANQLFTLRVSRIAVTNYDFPFTWQHPNLTAAVMIVPFDVTVPMLGASDTLGITIITPAYTGTSTQAWLRNVKIQRLTQ